MLNKNHRQNEISNPDIEDDDGYDFFHHVTMVLASGHVIKAEMSNEQEAEDTVESIAHAINSNSLNAIESPKRVVKVGQYYVDHAEIAAFHHGYTMNCLTTSDY